MIPGIILHDSDSCATHPRNLSIDAEIARILEDALISAPSAALLPAKGIILLPRICSTESATAATVANIPRPNISFVSIICFRHTFSAAPSSSTVNSAHCLENNAKCRLAPTCGT